MKKQQSAEKKDTLQELTEQLASELERRHATQNAILREGKQIVIPEFMTLTDASRAIRDWENSMEEDMSRGVAIAGHPSDTLYAFDQAMRRAFGHIFGSSDVVQTFFGAMKIPGQTKSIEIDYHKFISVPFGNVKVPGLPIKMNIGIKQKKNVMDSVLMINFEYRHKFAPLVSMIEDEINKELANNSVFRGKAIDSQFGFLNLKGFPLDRIVYAKKEKTQLDAHVFRLIKSTKAAKGYGLALKRTVLLLGKFGTGKTLTALLAANVCIENGWTFMSVVPGDDIAQAILFAKNYQPCVVFFEDIDQVTSGERDSHINRILNIVDGILSKNAEVMTILTTNHAEKIESAMLRPGRIDAVIEMGHIDEESLLGLVKSYCGNMLADDVNPSDLIEVADDYTPSFIAEACNRAILYAMERIDGVSNDGIRITQQDLKGALMGLRSQYNLMTQDRERSIPPMESAISEVVNDQLIGFFNRNVVKTLDVSEHDAEDMPEMK